MIENSKKNSWGCETWREIGFSINLVLRILTVLVCVHFIPFPLEKESQNYRQFVEELLKFKNIATRVLVCDGIMRKLGLLVYFLSKKEKTKYKTIQIDLEKVTFEISKANHLHYKVALISSLKTHLRTSDIYKAIPLQYRYNYVAKR